MTAGSSGRGRQAALLLVCALVLGGCGGGEREVRSVLLITLDTTRADALSGDAASRELAPSIARLADGGVRFPVAYTTAPLTLPAHASMLTGLAPPRHGVRDNGVAALAGSAETLAEVLAARGLETAAFVSSVVLDRGFGLDQGFERYDQPPLVERGTGQGFAERPAAETARAAIDWLDRRDRARPFFAWVHFYDPHLPYRPPEEFLEQAAGDAYRGEIAAVDHAVGELVAALERLGSMNSTLIVVTADHGESLGEHGEPTHGALCYEAAVRVPLIFRFPGQPPLPGATRVASAVDLFPTVLWRLGIAHASGLDGVDLFAPDAPADRGVYFESYSGYLNYGWSPLAGWLDARGKYLHSARPEFYLALQDPDERADLASQRLHECASARGHIEELLARPKLAPEERAAHDGLMAALAALGYATGAAVADLPSPLEPSTRPSPREREHELAPLLEAHALFEAGRFEEARPLVERIVRENAGHLLALDLLALCWMRAGRFAEAENVLRQRLERGPERADTRLNLGLCRLEQGDPEGARVELEAARQLAPDRPEILTALGRLPPSTAASTPGR